MTLRMIAACSAAAAMLAATGVAEGAVPTRLADLETPTTAPYDFDQVSPGCSGSTVARDATKARTGAASLQVHVADGCSAYARGIFEANGTSHLVEGNDVWFGAAIFLPTGFWDAKHSYVDFLRLDSYSLDAWDPNQPNGTPDNRRQALGLAAFTNDDLHVTHSAPGAGTASLIGPLTNPRVLLSENQWHWVEVRAKLSATSGVAVTELKIDGVSRGSSTQPNRTAGRDDYNRARYGLVATAGSGSGNLTAWVDRASLRPTELGAPPPPPPSYSTQVLSTPSLISYWRLGEGSGTLADDALGTNDGTYVNAPTLASAGLVTGEADTAVRFDGVNDHVTRAATSSLNPTGGVTLEAWVKPEALQGSVVKRNNSYELRSQGDGSVLFRVWTGSQVRTATSAAGQVTTGTKHHLAGTYDGTTMRIYRNGVEIKAQAQTGAMTHNVDPLLIGRNDFDNTHFKGTIDDVAVYGAALSAATVQAHYAAGA